MKYLILHLNFGIWNQNIGSCSGPYSAEPFAFGHPSGLHPNRTDSGAAPCPLTQSSQ